jgi:hypothetical protein
MTYKSGKDINVAVEKDKDKISKQAKKAAKKARKAEKQALMETEH